MDMYSCVHCLDDCYVISFIYTLRLRINKLRRLCFDSREYSETDKYAMKLMYRDLREYFAIFR